MGMYKHIIVATDLSEESKATAEKAVAFSKQFGSKLTVVHVIEPLPAYGYPGITALESPVIDDAKSAMAELGEALHIPEDSQRIEFGSVKMQILDIVKELGADLIIVGSHGRHGISRILGSTASAVVHGADCDVFVVRSAEAE